MGGEYGPVSRQGQAQGLGEAVHRIGSEHAGAGAAGWARELFELSYVAVRDLRVRRHHHCVNEIDFFTIEYARFHGPP